MPLVSCRAQQICLLNMGVNVAHSGAVRPPADDLHNLFAHAAAAADLAECAIEHMISYFMCWSKKPGASWLQVSGMSLIHSV